MSIPEFTLLICYFKKPQLIYDSNRGHQEQIFQYQLGGLWEEAKLI